MPSNKKFLVSTITPCYKMEKYLQTFLKELPKQTIFENIQVILDHNEPTEQEKKWVENFQDKYPNTIKWIIRDKVDPIGVSMNRCIENASTDKVAIWNIDDLRTLDSLEKQVKFLDDNPQFDVVFGNFVVVDKFPSFKGKFIDHISWFRRKEELEKSMILGPFFMWKKNLCERAGYFDEQLKSGADFDLAVRLAKNGNIGMVHGVLGYYLNEGKGASTKGDGRQQIERTLIEMRYGIEDKIDHNIVPYVQKENYEQDFIVSFGNKYSVKNFLGY